MLLIETSGLTKKYLWHSNDIDFFYFSDREIADEDDCLATELAELADLIQANIETSHSREAVLEDEEKPMSLRRALQFE